MSTCVVGPCECGGYGVVFNEVAQAKYGTCHLNVEDRLRAILRIDVHSLGIRVTQSQSGWRATVFHPDHGDLVGGKHVGPGRDEAISKAVQFARMKAMANLSIVEEQ